MTTSSALLCLALNIYHEARGEPEEGQIAVAMVTMNRANWQEEQICSVVYERRQFSWTHSSVKLKSKETASWEKAKRLAQSVINLQHNDITDGATHYHADYVRPAWGRVFEEKVRIGRHVFYTGTHRRTREE